MFPTITRTPVLKKRNIENRIETPGYFPQIDSFLSSLSQEDLLALSAWDTALWISVYIKQYGRLLVDKRDFDFEKHRYLIPLYRCNNQVISVMKAAQMCLTTWMMLKLVHFLLMAPTPCKAGIYFPTEELANKFAKDRFSDLLLDNPPLRQKMGFEDITHKFQESQTIKRIGPSSLYISYMGGKATQDATPFDAVAVDEVRLIQPIHFPRLDERLSHSDYAIKFFVSTAGMPETDIHQKFLEGTRNRFHSKCGCSSHDPEKWVVLSDHFPDCIVKTGPDRKDYGYVCPKCGYRIFNPQNGEFVAENPESDSASFHIHQMLSSKKTPYDILESFYQAEQDGNIKEWYNGKLGLPYVEQKDRMDIGSIRSCEDEHLLFGLNKKIKPLEVGMGIDQRSGENHVVIFQRIGSQYQLIHLEVIDQLNPAYLRGGKIVTPFYRCCELMELFNVNVCICDKEPNTNDAMAFGREFPGKVWLQKYTDSIDQPVLWSDRPTKKKGSPEKPSVRRSTKDIKYIWTVKMHRYSTIERIFKMFKEKQVIVPNSNSIVQYIRDKYGKYVRTFICREIYFKHLTSVVKTVEKQKKTGETVSRWLNIGGIDPHFLHATNYALTAMERARGFDFSFM